MYQKSSKSIFLSTFETIDYFNKTNLKSILKNYLDKVE